MTGSELVKELNYPDAPKGYHWRNHKSEPILVRNRGNKGPKLRYDSGTGDFIPISSAYISNRPYDFSTKPCFVPGTIVKTPGKNKKIETLKI